MKEYTAEFKEQAVRFVRSSRMSHVNMRVIGLRRGCR
jgi:transposase-like protein